MCINSQFPLLYVFYSAIGTLRIFNGAKHDRHVVITSLAENCPLYSGFRGRVARIVRCNINTKLMPENHTDTIDITVHCITNSTSTERTTVNFFTLYLIGPLLVFP